MDMKVEVKATEVKEVTFRQEPEMENYCPTRSADKPANIRKSQMVPVYRS
jgi:hypothetical protein